MFTLSLCGILMFGVGGFVLISAWDSDKLSQARWIAASALLVGGVGLFVTGIIKSY
jgi:hypothetical protein